MNDIPPAIAAIHANAKAIVDSVVAGLPNPADIDAMMAELASDPRRVAETIRSLAILGCVAYDTPLYKSIKEVTAAFAKIVASSHYAMANPQETKDLLGGKF